MNPAIRQITVILSLLITSSLFAQTAQYCQDIQAPSGQEKAFLEYCNTFIKKDGDKYYHIGFDKPHTDSFKPFDTPEQAIIGQEDAQDRNRSWGHFFKEYSANGGNAQEVAEQMLPNMPTKIEERSEQDIDPQLKPDDHSDVAKAQGTEGLQGSQDSQSVPSSQDTLPSQLPSELPMPSMDQAMKLLDANYPFEAPELGANKWGSGSKLFIDCTKILTEDVKAVYKKPDEPEIYRSLWADLQKQLSEALNEDDIRQAQALGSRVSPSTDQEDNLSSQDRLKRAYDNHVRALKKSIKLLGKCHALLTTLSEYSLGGNPTKATQTTSLPGETGSQISCLADTFETVDYGPCSNAKNSENLFSVGTKAQDAYHQIKLQGDNSDRQVELFQKANKGEQEATDGLVAYKDSVVQMKGQMQQKAAVQGGRLGALVTFYSQMPTEADVVERCQKKYTGTLSDGLIDDVKRFVEEKSNVLADLAHLNATPSASGQPLKGKRINVDDLINSAVSDVNCLYIVQNTHMIMNTQMKDMIAQRLAEAGIEVGKDLLLAKMLGDRAEDLDDLINKVENYEPQNTDIFLPEELVRLCQAQPYHPDCQTGGLPGTPQFAGNTQIDFGSPGGATTVGQGAALDDDSSDGSAAYSDNSAIGSISDTEPVDGVGHSGGLGDNGIGPAALGKPQDGGGGASGGGAGGTNMAGSSYTPPNNSIGGSNNAVSNNRRSGYTGANGYYRSTALKGKEKSKDTNPFAKLFNKDKSGQQVENFRGLASDQINSKNSDLFKKISTAYAKVRKQNKLLVYEN